MDAKRAEIAVVQAPSSEIGRVDAATLAVVQKHRELQEGLTDEMVVLAAQLKDSSMLMDSKSWQTNCLT
ncbi:unnamed protein product [Sphagnum tenellum]